MLKSISYEEYGSDPRYWRLEECDFGQVNLVVGKNATGKSRLINVIGGLCRVLRGEQAGFDSGHYTVLIELSDKLYSYEVEFQRGNVVSEKLLVDDEMRLERAADGSGRIYYQQQKDYIAFELPQGMVAIQHRQDRLQHPFVVELTEWAQGCKSYGFGTKFGSDEFVRSSALQGARGPAAGLRNFGGLIHRYSETFDAHGAAFDQAIIRDMKKLGYELEDVGVDDVRPLVVGAGVDMPEPVLGLFVVEAGLTARMPQNVMSQGMFRALAMVIHVNAEVLAGKKPTILVDDVGEGLDFERASGLIDLLIYHAKDAGMQVILTSNDRFVMNRVPLQYWVLLQREKSVVRAYTERNSAKTFEDFKFMGLSNFDFFASATFH
jgi:ABC-type transport system involved in cytochrome c biogenesis ATPase subunit